MKVVKVGEVASQTVYDDVEENELKTQASQQATRSRGHSWQGS
jgi:hypothetical protein